MQKIRALDIANYFIEIASKEDENDLTNLKLQKLLYFAQGKYLADKGKPLFQEEIEAWNLGPVVRDVYNVFKSCGAFPITVFDVKYKAKNIPEEVKHFIEKIWEKYGRYSASHLVNLAHKNNSPWYITYSCSNSSKVITKEDLTTYFKRNYNEY